MSFEGRVEALIVIPTGGAAVFATNSGGGPTACIVPAGSYYFTSAGGVSSLITELQTQLNASQPSGWTVTHSLTGTAATGRVTINCSQTPWSLTWDNATLRDALGFTANISSVSSAQTGANQARGLWFPKCPLMLDGDPGMAPKQSDIRRMVSPLGDVVSIVGNIRRRHRRVRWSHVPKDRFREASAALDYASWEAFLDDTQYSEGLSWFEAGSKIQIYDHNGQQVGVDAAVSGWFMHGVEGVDSVLAVPNHTAYYTIEIPEITTSG